MYYFIGIYSTIYAMESGCNIIYKNSLAIIHSNMHTINKIILLVSYQPSQEYQPIVSDTIK